MREYSNYNIEDPQNKYDKFEIYNYNRRSKRTEFLNLLFEQNQRYARPISEHLKKEERSKYINI